MDLSGVIKGIEKLADKAIEINENDYLNDEGLLMCGNCNTPKQVKVDVLGEIRTPKCLCKCQKEKLERENAERKQQEFIQRIKRLRSVGFPDAEMQSWTFANDDRSNEKISTVARNYVDNFSKMYDEGKGLLLYGPVGTGKTFISACIANALIDKGHACLVTNFARLTNTISGMFEGKQEYLDNLDRYSLLVIDDLASERDTEYMGEIVHNIIDARYRCGKPLIVTTNLTSDELKHPADMRKQRVFSRLFEMCIPIEVSGNDRRKEKLKSDYQNFEKLLGL